MRRRETINARFNFPVAAKMKLIGFLREFLPITCLGLRGSSLRLFLVFGTPFFHLVITID